VRGGNDNGEEKDYDEIWSIGNSVLENSFYWVQLSIDLRMSTYDKLIKPRSILMIVQPTTSWLMLLIFLRHRVYQSSSFWRTNIFVLLILCIHFLVSIVLTSTLVVIIYLHLLVLGLTCSCVYKSLRCIIRLFIIYLRYLCFFNLDIYTYMHIF
jgi:hypothetical protein